uniref:Uncharacterized protein n=1 Tax=Fagus sylvatica TaxID=28930 RepID=A0A2N9H5R7_FAGSY
MEPSAERLVEFPMVVLAFTIKWRRKQANSEDWKARVAALETKFNFLLQFIRRWTEREEEKKKATISKRQKEIYPALSLSKAAQTLPTPRRPAFHIPRPSRTEPRQFQPLPIPVPQLYTLLIKKKMITPVKPEDAYRATAQRLQQRPDLIEGVINTIGAEKDEEVDITSTKIPWEPLFHELKKRGLLPAPRAPKESTEAGTCQYHPGARDHNLQGCEEFKKEVAGLITKGLIRRRGEQPERDCMTIDQLRLSPYEKTNFQARMERIEEDFEKFCERKKEELGKAHTSHTTGNVQTRSSGHPLCYQRKGHASDSFSIRGSIFGESSKRGDPSSATLPLPRQKEAGKAVEDPTKTKATEEEAADFLRIIKSSEYSIVKQLSKMPSHISVLSLLLASESHRKALLKVLNEAYVPEDITGPSFENMVTSILVTNQLTFSDDELPPEGRGHTKALYISVKTNDRIVSRVLIDNGSALNVCPLSTLEKLDIDPTRVRVNSMVVRAFDGTRREVLGEIDLPVEIGPQVYDINFQVLRIDSPYNLLLGRPWLHTAGAVPSSLHQKMKLIIGNQLVTILAEEPISIYNDGEIPYIDGCAPEEASFHSMDWGIPRPEGIVRWPMKPGGKELQRSSRGEKWPERKMVIPHIRTTFPASAMFQVDEGDVDELALLFTEDLNVNAITTEGDSAAFPIHADQHEEIDLEDFLDEENLKGYRIEEETLDEDTWEDDDLPDLLPHLMVPHGLDTLEFEIFCEHGDPESHLRKVRGHLVLSAEEYAHVGGDSGKSFSGPIPMQPQGSNTTSQRSRQRAIAEEGEEPLKAPPPSIITTTTAEEEYAGPMVEGLSIHTIAEEEDSTTTPPTRHCQQGEEAKTWTCVPLLQRVSKPREVKIGTRCAAEQKEALIALLREFHEIFAWSYQDMPGLDTDIVVHKIPLKPECKPVKQALRRMKPEVILKIKEEVEKQLKAGFLSTVTYSDWVANIVPVPKKDGKVRMCVDYRDLNRASPKDNFPLPHIDTLVDNTATNVVFSFMDGFSGYNQIKMAEEDKSKTAFITHWGTFVYDVMPFGLKNAGATYQRAMVTLFHDMIHHEIEVYVDDMIAKSRTAQDHLTDLRKLFQRLKKYQLRLNPNKCAFGVTSGKLLGFIVSGRGIEIDPAKVQAIRSMPAPKTEKEIRSFLGRINYIARFIAQLTATCEPLFKLLRKDVKIKWTEDCQRAFDKIKEYLLNPPILVPPTPGRPLILYLTVQEASMGCMLGQQDETGKKEQAIYYLSKKFTEPETRYLLVEKTCCALAWASKKLRQYMLYYTTWLVSRNGPDQAIKGQAIADYLADYPSEQLELMDSEFPDEDVMTVDEDNHGRWKLYFDGAANAVGSGIGAVLVSPKGQQTPIATNGEWQARDPKLIPYQRYISRLVPKFKYVTFTYTPRAHNHFADALATLASLIKLVEGDDVRPLRIETRDIPAYCVCIEECMNVEAEIDNKPWYYDIKRFIQDRECRRGQSIDSKEMHAGLMGAHANGPFLARKIMRAGYYWLTMERDCIRHVQTCHKCQMYQNSKNAPPQYLHTMASPWPFSAWGMDVIGAITPKASNGHEFILVAIDYFTKWVEACSFKNVTQVAVTRFVKNNIICRYGMPEMLITDNASNLNNRMMDQLCQQFKIQHHNSAPYRPKMNGAVEAANKNVKKILSKMTETYKDWHEHLPYAFVCLPNVSEDIRWSHPLLSGVWDGSSTTSRSGDPFFENPVTNSAGRSLNGPKHGRIERAYNKKARPRTFQPGDLVLKKRNMALSDPRGKFAPSYEGPYVVKKAFSGGAIILADMDGEEFRSPINSDSVIKYHV